jgi:hypothetical protein
MGVVYVVVFVWHEVAVCEEVEVVHGGSSRFLYKCKRFMEVYVQKVNDCDLIASYMSLFSSLISSMQQRVSSSVILLENT